MLELDVFLDFACCVCHHPMGVTLKCEGKDLASYMDQITSIKVPCPTCGSNNQIDFTPSGQLVRVRPEPRTYAMPVPSYN